MKLKPHVKTTDLLKNITKINSMVKISSILVIIVILYLMFLMNWVTLSIFVLGVAFIYLLFRAYDKPNKETPFYFVLSGIGAFITYFFFNNLLFIGMFLLGANIITFFLYSGEDKKVQRGIQILNVVTLSGLVLESGIRKFRGFNKLEFDDIQITIALIVLITFAVYFLVQIFRYVLKNNKHANSIVAVVAVVFTSIAYYFLSYFFYLEIGLSKIYAPLLYGLVAALIEYFFYERNVVRDFVQITLVFISSYAISGILGIALAFLSAYLFKDIVSKHLFVNGVNLGNSTKNKDNKNLLHNCNSILDSTSQLLFLFAAIEVQENAGYIMRFNLSAGFQTGWLLISTVLYEYALQLYKWLTDLLRKYAMSPILSTVTTLLVIISIALVMKIGHNEAIASLLIASGIYLLIVSLIKKDMFVDYWFVVLLSNIVGIMSFLVLALA